MIIAWKKTNVQELGKESKIGIYCADYQSKWSQNRKRDSWKGERDLTEQPVINKRNSEPSNKKMGITGRGILHAKGIA